MRQSWSKNAACRVMQLSSKRFTKHHILVFLSSCQAFRVGPKDSFTALHLPPQLSQNCLHTPDPTVRWREVHVSESREADLNFGILQVAARPTVRGHPSTDLNLPGRESMIAGECAISHPPSSGDTGAQSVATESHKASARKHPPFSSQSRRHRIGNGPSAVRSA